MAFETQPPTQEQEKPRSVKITPEALTNILGPERTDAAENAPTVIEDVSALSHMQLPASFRELTSNKPHRYADCVLRIFDATDANVQVNLWNRGATVDSDINDKFARVLSKQGSVAQLDLQDLYPLLSMNGITSGASDDFLMLGAQVKNINGKSVLIVDGTRKQINYPVQALYWMATEADGKPRVQSMVYEGSRADFNSYMPQFRRSLETIRWH